MGSNELAKGGTQGPLYRKCWLILCGGIAANAAACLWYKVFDSLALPLLIVGLLITGTAVAIRPRSAAVLALAALSGFLACWGFRPWDSAQLVVGVFAAVAAFAAIVVLLPRAIQRALVSVIIVVHFVGILSAVSNVPPAPALMSWAWNYFYRPYLQFMYLNNAYHFYSPEPGPGILVWFYVRYDDGSADWYKIPDRAQNPLAQEYQRRLSLAESTNQLQPVGPVPDELYRRRLAAWKRDRIPPHPNLDIPVQRREPTQFSKEMVKNYARFVAHLKARETGKAVAGVKVYRVVHSLPTAKELAMGSDPAELHFYYPYFQGEFTAEGELKNAQDPYLYWLIPIVKVHDVAAFRAGKVAPAPEDEQRDFEILDLLEEHARLELDGAAESQPDFVPGKQVESPPQKNAAASPAAVNFRP